ncbi:MAG: hypothetical protein WCQ03_09030 [Phycisphaerae bacterium]
MKLFISILVLAFIAGAAAFLWPQSQSKFNAEISLNDNAQAQPTAITPTAPIKTEELTTTTSTNVPATTPSLTTTPVATSTSVVAARPIAQPATITHGNNNQLEVDGRYTILGSGTELDPYRITWDLLKSAYETMDLNGSRVTPPKRLEILNGTFVQISGYLAPPLWGQETKELLVMLNRWDGCCVGLPPTPFDCIEAQLAAPMKLGAAHTISYGTIRGKFIVEPFKAGTFLIGLYRLEEAQTDDTKSR